MKFPRLAWLGALYTWCRPAPPADPEGVMPWETERRITQVAAINRNLSELLAQDHEREAARLRQITELKAMCDHLIAAGYILANGYPAKSEEWAAAVSAILEGRAPAGDPLQLPAAKTVLDWCLESAPPGYIHEDELPEDISDADYSVWFDLSFVPGGFGCRVGPWPLPATPAIPTEPQPEGE